MQVELFQFHKGTIKTLGLSSQRHCRVIFQFHKGTIKTDVRTKSLYTARGFQFHKGTIKTPKSLSCIPFACISIP